MAFGSAVQYVAVSRRVVPVKGRVERRNGAARTPGRRPEASPDERRPSGLAQGQGTPAAGTGPVSGRTGTNGPERLPPWTWQAARRWTPKRSARLAAATIAPAARRRAEDHGRRHPLAARDGPDRTPRRRGELREGRRGVGRGGLPRRPGPLRR